MGWTSAEVSSNCLDGKWVYLPKRLWLTANQIWEWAILSDKEKMRWAIMTENAIKTQPYSLIARESARNENNELEEKKGYRTSLNDNNLLFIVYPDNNPVVTAGSHLSYLEKKSTVI